ncbi:MAG: recombinase family protein [Anaerocolumna sp.]
MEEKQFFKYTDFDNESGNIRVNAEKAALYCRLSKEDQDKINQGDESASIQNQKMLLVDYALDHKFVIYDIYFDDDYSGLDSERPAFKKLIRDAKNGCFNMIICKTQSRFTRDMELVEKYIHGLFPLIGIRFIGVVDNVDTDVKGNKKARQINGLINEWYCEDLSENIRSVFRSKMEKGQFLGAYALYGYKKDPGDNHKLIIDEEAANVVRKIFTYAVQGMGNRQICDKLYEEKIPTPCIYKKHKGLSYQHSLKEETFGKAGIWGVTTIRKMLSNRMYLGDMVQGRERKVSYKSKKVIEVPESEWIIVPNRHEPIIEKDVFDLVQELRNVRRYASTPGVDGKKKISLLAGKVKCKKCGSTLTRINGNTTQIYLYCQLYLRSKKEQCTPHSILYSKLIEILEERIRNIISKHLEQNQIKKYFIIQNENKKLLSVKQSELAKFEDKLVKTKKAVTMLYVDKVNGILSDEEYIDIKNSLNKEAGKLNKLCETLEADISSLTDKSSNQDKKEDLIRKYAEFDVLNHEIINEFVDYIEVGDKDTDNNQEVIIHWRF